MHLDEIHGPYDLRQTKAIRWIDQYGKYIQDLEDYFRRKISKPKMFENLPFNGKLQLSAKDCILQLTLQEAALRKIDSDDVCVRLAMAVKRYGTKRVAEESGLNRDTIADIAAGRVTPHTKTAEKIEKYLESVAL
jgi:hypothetical protein